MADWFYQVMGTEIGPISSAELRQKAADGTIDETTLIRQGTNGEWISAHKTNLPFRPQAAPAINPGAPAVHASAARAASKSSPAIGSPIPAEAPSRRFSFLGQYAHGGRFHWSITAASALFAVLVGYFLGREHIKYELRSALSEAGKAFSEGLQESFGGTAERDTVETKSSATPPSQTRPMPSEAPASEPRLPEIVEFGRPFAAAEFEISLIRARIDRPEVQDLFGETGRAKTPDLLLSFRVKNTHERKILRYDEDSGFLAGNFRLRDDVENVIRGVNYGVGSRPIGALSGGEDILPGKEAAHLKAFGVPPPKTKYLVLTVDLAAFGGEGKTRFRIPVERIENFVP